MKVDIFKSQRGTEKILTAPSQPRFHFLEGIAKIDEFAGFECSQVHHRQTK
jgi:hypothetical protein